jgi:hypothetical protein
MLLFVLYRDTTQVNKGFLLTLFVVLTEVITYHIKTYNLLVSLLRNFLQPHAPSPLFSPMSNIPWRYKTCVYVQNMFLYSWGWVRMSPVVLRLYMAHRTSPDDR